MCPWSCEKSINEIQYIIENQTIKYRKLIIINKQHLKNAHLSYGWNVCVCVWVVEHTRVLIWPEPYTEQQINDW